MRQPQLAPPSTAAMPPALRAAHTVVRQRQRGWQTDTATGRVGRQREAQVWVGREAVGEPQPEAGTSLAVGSRRRQGR